MENDDQVIVDSSASEETSQRSRPVVPTSTEVSPVRSAERVFVKDWRTLRYVFFGVILVMLTFLVVFAYYLNHPFAEPRVDT